MTYLWHILDVLQTVGHKMLQCASTVNYLCARQRAMTFCVHN